MPKIDREILIAARPEQVWEILSDTHHVPKLYPDLLSIKFEPHVPAVVGQRRTLTGKIGKRMIEIHTRVAEVVPVKRLVVVGGRGGAFEEFRQTVELSETAEGTKVHVTYHFKISEAYFGPEFYIPVLEQAAIENEDNYLKNLKEIAELEPPKSESET
ncbi:MAG: SRPBCC family protein [Thaumarchaeota archaeon]|nr:SRPBCC family protein [Nitrososphaerota archaeon]